MAKQYFPESSSDESLSSQLDRRLKGLEVDRRELMIRRKEIDNELNSLSNASGNQKLVEMLLQEENRLKQRQDLLDKMYQSVLKEILALLANGAIKESDPLYRYHGTIIIEDEEEGIDDEEAPLIGTEIKPTGCFWCLIS